MFNSGDTFQYKHEGDDTIYEIEVFAATDTHVAFETRGPFASPMRDILHTSNFWAALDGLGATPVPQRKQE